MVGALDERPRRGWHRHECGLTELELGSRVFARGRRVAEGEGPEGAPGVVRRCWPDPVREALAWTTLVGREYVTYPKNWRESLHDEPAEPDTSIEEEPPPF